ncbi:class I SAM-dependent DNA methyltransferase [Chitinophaga sancti]|uniref:site-specific DNA-methyltransferase (adenine-specific) n=1 Tax=Chitinophaga sancti TaxID=1004 RepID=A0A1K1S7L6_9BACT|nr:class I SAM-dependent DNA methyltransferase [Chitinophaga sancti]WQD62135.1 class I SAM-dependent DNA methyltransferase [Chitinophaga sancti]WQG92296.1 class I SAM-dependent DNA methyltransferase [Chitinophaga sancti]SFW80310.1 type I restriction enzyme M protein [Chitinophaga sancti]
MTNNLVAKIWSFCDTLRDDGVSYGDYLEQITYLLFLKMAEEHTLNNNSNYNIPKNCEWKSLLGIDVSQLINVYAKNLKTLSDSGGMLSKIFNGAQNKIHDQYKLRKLIELINEENWISESVDVKGDIYESLLQKNAESSGAGQYFTPRPIIQAMVECISPKPMETISDPSCGTGGFFLGALNYIRDNYKLSKKEQDFLKFKTFHGWEIVPSTARLCLMNLFLHGIGDLKTTPDIEVADSLKESLNEKVNIVLANPPFGKTSSDIITNDEKKAKIAGYFYRKDIWTTTSNKQLAFLQHIVSMLSNEEGKAAVVLPDNVLFEGGAGETIRKRLIHDVDLHTILRLPTGIFYAQGVKANVLFFETKKKGKTPATKDIWIYDYRTNIHHTLKKNTLQFENLEDFVDCYNPKNRNKRVESWSQENPEGRWRRFSYEEIMSRDKANLDIFWLKDNDLIDFDNLPEAENIINDIIENLESALANFKTIRDTVAE